MSSFFGYLTNITYYLLFAVIAGMVAPAGKYKKFVSLVMGFVLVMAVLSPLRNFTRDFPLTDWFAGMAGTPAMQNHFPQDDYAGLHNRHLAAAFEEQLAIQLENLLAREGFALHEADFSYTEDFTRITGVWVRVSREEEARRVPFIRIEPVRVNRAEAETDPVAEDVKSLLAGFYNLAREHIHVSTK